LAKDVFSEIEKPPPTEVLETLRDIATLWHRLPNDQGGNWRFDNRSGMYHGKLGILIVFSWIKEKAFLVQLLIVSS